MEKIAYFSPLNPIKSGISDYSEDLIPALSRYYDIDIYIPDSFQPSNDNVANFGTLRYYYELPANYNIYKTVIYHMGNNYDAHHEIYEMLLKYPGVVVLHDFSLHHFFAQRTLDTGDKQAYLNEVLYCHGEEGLEAANKFLKGKAAPLWETQSLKYPLNLRVFDHASSVIVHSRFARKQIEQLAPFVPVFEVPMLSPQIIDDTKSDEVKTQARETLGIDDDTVVISTLGHVNPTKRVDKILIALGQLKKEKKIPKFKFIIAGQINGDYPIQSVINKAGLQNDVICTGYISLDEFEMYIAASDFCINLRYPTQGESSASLLRILGYGKPVIVTDIGSFSDFDLDYVIKISYGANEIEELKESIEQLANSNLIASPDILRYVRYSHSIERVALEYKQVVDNTVADKSGNVMIALNRYFEKLSNRTTQFHGLEPFDQFVGKTASEIANTFLE